MLTIQITKEGKLTVQRWELIRGEKTVLELKPDEGHEELIARLLLMYDSKNQTKILGRMRKP